MTRLRQWFERRLRSFARWSLRSDWAWVVPLVVGCAAGIFIGRLL